MGSPVKVAMGPVDLGGEREMEIGTFWQLSNTYVHGETF